MWISRVVIFSLASCGALADGPARIYESKDDWAEEYPEFCAGSSQSPIVLPSRKGAVSDPRVKPLYYRNYRKSFNASMINDQNHVKINLDVGDDDIEIFGSEFSNHESYRFDSFHIHWGSTDDQGSEHVIEGRAPYAAEVHLIHYNTKYADIAEALTHKDGLVVLGIFIEVSGRDNPAYEPIVSRLSELSGQTEKTESTPFEIKLESLFPCSPTEFYQYQGSLTTPTCNEVVNWHVFAEPVHLSESQIAEFRAVKDETGLTMNDNYRNPQPRNNRKVVLYTENEMSFGLPSAIMSPNAGLPSAIMSPYAGLQSAVMSPYAGLPSAIMSPNAGIPSHSLPPPAILPPYGELPSDVMPPAIMPSYALFPPGPRQILHPHYNMIYPNLFPAGADYPLP